jgi:DNA-binding LytR/AlgR family response regulator
MDHYLTLYLMDRKILERKSIKEFFESIDIENFVQVHKSFVVNKDFIKSVGANKIILSNNQAVPLSRTYKAKFPWQDYLKIIQKGF